MRNSVDHWKNRRRMAWVSIISGIMFPLLLLFTNSEQLGAISAPFYLFVGTVVGAYIGFATMDDKSSRESGNFDDAQPEKTLPRGRN